MTTDRQKTDGTYSKPIVIDRNYICKEEFIPKALKSKKKYFEHCIKLKDNKYKAKNTSLVDREEMFKQALNEDTPLLLGLFDLRRYLLFITECIG